MEGCTLAKKYFKVIILLAFIGVFVYLIFNFKIYDKNSVEDFFIQARQDKNFSIFFITITTLLVIFFVPISWLTALAAFFFGLKGFIHIIIAGIIGCIIAFYISRVYQEDVMNFVYKNYYKKKRKIDLDEVKEKINQFGMGYVFFLRSMPFIPYATVNYVSGITSINFWDYLLGTILGMGPGLFITTYFFTKAVSIKEDPMGAIVAALIKVAYVAIVIMWQKKSKYKTKE